MKKFYSILMFSLTVSLSFAQVELVKDIRSGAESTLISEMAANNEKIIFRGNNSTDGAYNVVFVSDGTTDNVREVEINTGGHSMAGAFTVFNNEIYFCATDGTTYGIYRIDETTDTGVKAGDFDWKMPVVHAGMVYFMDKQTDTDNKAIHSWDGTTETTLAHQENIAGTGKFIPFGDNFLLYGKITDEDPDKGIELLLLDPSSGVTRLTDFNFDMDDTPDSVDAKITEFVTFGDKAYFIAWNQFWETDGTKENTRRVDVVNDELSGSDYFGNFYVWNDKIYCKGNNVIGESQLYVFDPQGNTFTRMTDYQIDYWGTGTMGSHFLDPRNFIANGDCLYFTGQDTIVVDNKTPRRLYRTNGVNIERVTDAITDVDHLTLFDGNIYMEADDGTTGRELYVYHPTAYPIVDPNTGIIEPAFKANSITVFPNPSYGYINLTGLETNDAAYTLFDLTGRSCEKGMVINNMINYKVKSGTYILHVGEGRNAKIIKVIVK
ncbi:MAG: T9SS type A sorting domain-containing protein [Bacteroidota bacterium]